MTVKAAMHTLIESDRETPRTFTLTLKRYQGQEALGAHPAMLCAEVAEYNATAMGIPARQVYLTASRRSLPARRTLEAAGVVSDTEVQVHPNYRGD